MYRCELSIKPVKIASDYTLKYITEFCEDMSIFLCFAKDH